MTTHMDALLARDIDRVMGDYDDDSVLRTEHGDNRGRGPIRTHLQQALDGAPDGSSFERTVETDTDARVVVRWRLLSKEGDQILSGHDSFVLAQGVIRRQEVIVDR